MNGAAHDPGGSRAAVPEVILHLALSADWQAARTTGEYRVSTLGRTLEQEGFIHACADRAQLDGVADRFYRTVTEPLTLLTVDPRGLDVRMEAPAGPAPAATETFPHVYGPIPVFAVISATPFTLC
ncbi:DUF952 domain-containing protein [Planomonospora parontospora]|uniref:DUF952 domain-containing protein n=1 Tax=Planomonospora parontospora TaxID=58119 RepID=UPI001670966E|nr:DUF952 domain-containing protein [Planomonospora parontospora]GGL46659.1 hypothetical protein GCM10014719_54980 [Planomonospora parontospora subsp. antibiotica]GII19414.1 hypothetical protein Ppa05_61400 [Planomonospora parontospora subsp. antibiotica]